MVISARGGRTETVRCRPIAPGVMCRASTEAVRGGRASTPSVRHAAAVAPGVGRRTKRVGRASTPTVRMSPGPGLPGGK